MNQMQTTDDRPRSEATGRVLTGAAAAQARITEARRTSEAQVAESVRALAYDLVQSDGLERIASRSSRGRARLIAGLAGFGPGHPVIRAWDEDEARAGSGTRNEDVAFPHRVEFRDLHKNDAGYDERVMAALTLPEAEFNAVLAQAVADQHEREAAATAAAKARQEAERRANAQPGVLAPPASRLLPGGMAWDEYPDHKPGYVEGVHPATALPPVPAAQPVATAGGCLHLRSDGTAYLTNFCGSCGERMNPIPQGEITATES